MTNFCNLFIPLGIYLSTILLVFVGAPFLVFPYLDLEFVDMKCTNESNNITLQCWYPLKQISWWSNVCVSVDTYKSGIIGDAKGALLLFIIYLTGITFTIYGIAAVFLLIFLISIRALNMIYFFTRP